MPGWGSVLQRGASYIGGMGRGAAAGMSGSFMRSQASGLGYRAGYGAANIGKGLATGKYGAAASGAFYGAGWGMMSDDTSVLGGMAAGAALGAGGRLGVRATNSALTANIRGKAMGPAFTRRMSRDLSVMAGRAHSWGSRMRSNLGNQFQSTLKNWS